MDANWERLESGLLHRCLLDTAVAAATVAALGDYRWSLPQLDWVWKFMTTTFDATGEMPSVDTVRAAATSAPRAAVPDPADNGALTALQTAVELILATRPEPRPNALRRMLIARQQRRRALEAIATATDKMAAGQDSAAMAALERASGARGGHRVPQVQPLVPRVLKRMQVIDRCPTGLDKLDRIVGGLGRGELGIFKGVAGVGKSMVTVNLSRGGLRYGWNILVLDTENGETITRSRHIARLTGIPADRIEEQKLTTDQRERLESWLYRNYDRLSSQLRLAYLGMNESTLADVDAAIVRAVNEGFTPDLIVFDSPDHLRLGGSNGKFDASNRWAFFSELYKDLAARAKRYNVAMWVTNQAGNAAEGKIATTKHNRDSQDKDNMASLVISINRMPGAEEADPGRCLYVSKARNKPAMFRIDLETDAERMLLRAPFDDFGAEAAQDWAGDLAGV